MNITTLPPLSLYVHIPWCVKKCPYCDFNSHTLKTDTAPEDAYISALCADLDHDLDRFSLKNRPLHSIFIGGGTPSLFSGEAIGQLLQHIKQALPASNDTAIEVTLEANPGTLTLQRLEAFKHAGVNRLSIGVQSFDNNKLKAIGRIHDQADALLAIEHAQKVGFQSINVDLMYALPGQTQAEAMADLKQALQLSPQHISWYELTLEPHTLFYQRPPKHLPNNDKKWSIQQEGKALLAKHQYTQYEVSAFSQASHQCQHNLNYWRFGDYLGIGAGAHGKITQASGQCIRSTKTKHPQHYLNTVPTEPLAAATYKAVKKSSLPLEFMLNHLRLYEPLPLQRFEARTGLPVSTLEAPLKQLVSLKLLTCSTTLITPSSTIALTQRGGDLLDEVLGYFVGAVAH